MNALKICFIIIMSLCIVFPFLGYKSEDLRE